VPGCLSINSLRFDAAGPSTVTVGAAEMLRIASGGMLQTSNVTTGVSTITGGTLASGTGELIFTTDGTQRFDVSSSITATTAITKSGDGTLRLSGVNTGSGTLTLQLGTVELTGGSALGDTAGVTFLEKGGSPTLSLLAGQTETIGSLSGGGTGNSTSTVALGAGSTLTINQTTAALTYGGFFTGAAGTTLIKSGSQTLTYAANGGAGFVGDLMVNQGILLFNGNVTQFTAAQNRITINGSTSSLQINQDNTAGINRVTNTTPVTLNNTAGGLGFYVTRNGGSTA